MRIVSRKISLVVFAGLVITAFGCSSNNKSKIEGKWRLVSGGVPDADIQEIEKDKSYVFVEFRPDGTFTLGINSSDRDMQKIVDEVGVTSLSKYKLLSGDSVDFYELSEEMQKGLGGKKDHLRGNIKIEGDDMTIVVDEDSEGPIKLTRVK